MRMSIFMETRDRVHTHSGTDATAVSEATASASAVHARTRDVYPSAVSVGGSHFQCAASKSGCISCLLSLFGWFARNVQMNIT